MPLIAAWLLRYPSGTVAGLDVRFPCAHVRYDVVRSHELVDDQILPEQEVVGLHRSQAGHDLVRVRRGAGHDRVQLDRLAVDVVEDNLGLRPAGG